MPLSIREVVPTSIETMQDTMLLRVEAGTKGSEDSHPLTKTDSEVGIEHLRTL